MSTVGAERHRFDETNGGQGQSSVEMREERSAARGLETQRLAERLSLDRDQVKIVASREMLRGRLGQLLGRREMDEAVALIDRRAAIDALPLRLAPFRVSANLEDEGHDHFRLRDALWSCDDRSCDDRFYAVLDKRDDMMLDCQQEARSDQLPPGDGRKPFLNRKARMPEQDEARLLGPAHDSRTAQMFRAKTVEC